MEAMFKYLQDSAPPAAAIKTETDWSFKESLSCPRQNNNYDCGMFTCMYAYYLSKSVELPSELFTVDEVKKLRKTFYDAIMEQNTMIK